MLYLRRFVILINSNFVDGSNNYRIVILPRASEYNQEDIRIDERNKEMIELLISIEKRGVPSNFRNHFQTVDGALALLNYAKKYGTFYELEDYYELFARKQRLDAEYE